MLLVHQTGSVKVGEVVRHTVTYTPELDRILPLPERLHVKIKNTSAIPLRAAYIHGPYTLHVAAYPSTFHPNRKLEEPLRDGVPQYEPQLKAGGAWNATLNVPEDVRHVVEDASSASPTTSPASRSVTWIVEIASQIIFSASAAVQFEVLIGRDAKSLDLGSIAMVGGTSQAGAGRVEDHRRSKESKHHHHAAQPKGVYSKAIKLVVDDTASLWNRPPLPQWEHDARVQEKTANPLRRLSTKDSISTLPKNTIREEATEHSTRKQKRVHLVVLTHGLHSNIGADMLYLKESIDEAASHARADAQRRRARLKERGRLHAPSSNGHAKPPQDPEASPSAEAVGTPDEVEEEDTEEVIVRGFTDNAVRTEKGIKYLGKRLAKYVLSMTSPQLPFVEVKQSATRSLTRSLTGQGKKDDNRRSMQANSATPKPPNLEEKLAYRITSISFIGHSLGGLIQTYAVAYIQKHSPRFFRDIEPINFVALATPFLGLSNENPIYVKFALDSGIVGRTGKDLGLTWRAPTIARNGWGAMVAGLGSSAAKAEQEQAPGSKPLLRILPTGPAHVALKLFRNRTVYSNVVNDGIVPLRTSCLLFLDWSGLERVEKARRENGLVGTVAGWGWAELTGTNAAARRSRPWSSMGEGGLSSDDATDAGSKMSARTRGAAEVPQPPESAANEDAVEGLPAGLERHHSATREGKRQAGQVDETRPQGVQDIFGGFLSFFQPQRGQSTQQAAKTWRLYKRGQTVQGQHIPVGTNGSAHGAIGHDESPPAESRPQLVRGDSALNDPNNPLAPPKTTIFESAGDILNPPLPSTEFLIDPSSRARTIFHDRVYHPGDIPPVPLKRRTGTTLRGYSSGSDGLARSDTDYESGSEPGGDSGGMKVEEKIARAYHRDLSWRKVLVRLEPDAHNNMIVRRIFANAHGWPVVKHLVDTHFADSYAATTRDEDESRIDRARSMEQGVGRHGEELKRESRRRLERTESENKEARDGVGELQHSIGGRSTTISRQDSAQWTDAAFDLTDDEDEEEGEGARKERASPKGTTEAEIADFLTASPSRDPSREEVVGELGGEATQTGLGKSVEEGVSHEEGGGDIKSADADGGEEVKESVMEEAGRSSLAPASVSH
ncbi:MAG: hypothetical protein M1832_004172 [Thelocarpon impressellum]|nr:MAG: hypothetical protein M1832_004172 [Thelocarpon impressellum]